MPGTAVVVLRVYGKSRNAVHGSIIAEQRLDNSHDGRRRQGFHNRIAGDLGMVWILESVLAEEAGLFIAFAPRAPAG